MTNHTIMHRSSDSRSNFEEANVDAALHAGSARALKVAVIVLASIATIWALHWARVFLIPLAVAVCMTFWLMPLVDGLQRLRIPRLLGAAIVLGGLIGGVGSAAYVLRDDARGFATDLSVAARHARMIFDETARNPDGWIHSLRRALGDRSATVAKSKTPPPVADAKDIEAAVVKGSTAAMLAIVHASVVLFTIYMMLAAGDLYKRKLVTVISHETPGATLGRKRLTVEIVNEIAAQFQRYLGVLIITNIIIGLAVWGAFAALDLQHAAVWGTAAAVLHFIPYVGPAALAVASFLVGAHQFDSLAQASLVALTSVMIFGVIGLWLQTWLSGRAANMNAVAVFVSLMLWGWLWGIAGLLIGTPLTMAVKVIADRVEWLHWLGTFLGEAPKRERKSATQEPADSAVTESVVDGEPAFVGKETAAEAAATARLQSDSVVEHGAEHELFPRDRAVPAR